jgi:hypothetical protein
MAQTNYFSLANGILSIIALLSSFASFFNPAFKVYQFTDKEDIARIIQVNTNISFGLLFMGLIFAVLFMSTSKSKS